MSKYSPRDGLAAKKEAIDCLNPYSLSIRIGSKNFEHLSEALGSQEKLLSQVLDVRVGGKNRKQIELEASAKGMFIHNSLFDIMEEKKLFQTHETLKTIRLTPEELGMKGNCTMSTLILQAATMNLRICPPDLAPYLRLTYTDQPVGRCLLLMNPISDFYPSADSQCIFTLGRDDQDSIWMGSRIANLHSFLNINEEYVFVVPKRENK
jgi:hypothetical protein